MERKRNILNGKLYGISKGNFGKQKIQEWPILRKWDKADQNSQEVKKLKVRRTMTTKVPTLQQIKVKPQWVAQQCPTCHGWTKMKYGKEDCPTCKGQGFIKVPTVEEGEPKI